MGFLIAPIFRGIDTDLVLGSNTTDSPVDCTFTGSTGSLTGSGTNASLTSYLNYPVFIHQSQGTGAGQQERNVITGYSGGTITFALPLSYTYTTGAQLVVFRSSRSITVNSGVTWSGKSWNGSTGGILALIASGGLYVNGVIDLSGKGFLGGSAVTGGNTSGKQGEGINGVRDTTTTSANGNAGGGGTATTNFGAGGGAAGGNGMAGTSGGNGGTNGFGGTGGAVSGAADLTAATFGGGGGSGGVYNSSGSSGAGGIGGGLLVVYTPRLIVNTSTGNIFINGGNGGDASGTGGDRSAGGGGAGGSGLFYIIYGSGLNRISAVGGNPGTGSGSVGTPGTGGAGRIAIGKGSITDATTTSPVFYDKGYQTYCGLVGRG